MSAPSSDRRATFSDLSRRTPPLRPAARAACRAAVQSLEPRRLMHGVVDLSINFAPKRVPGVEGMLSDVGLVYGDRGDGLIYGWQKDNTKNARDRNLIADQGLDTLAMLQVNGGRKKWEIELPNGEYDVTIASGDARYVDSVNHINVEGLNVVKTAPSAAHPFNIKTRTITVADGKLTVRPGADAENAKINWIRIQTVHIDGGESVEPTPAPTPPSVSASAADATAVEGDAAATGLLRLTRGGDETTEFTVALAWSGTADASDVTSPRPTSVTFAAGQTIIDLPVVAAADALAEASEDVTLTVVAGTGYTVGASATASVAIANVTPAPDPEPDPEPEPEPEPTPDPVLTGITWAKTSASPPATFSEATSEVVNGKLYLFGGFNAAFSPQNKVYRFDGTSWTTMANAPVAFTHVGSAVVGDKVWFAGGYIGNGSGGQIFGTEVVRIYDTTTDTWTTGPSLPQKRASGSLVLLNNSLYYFGGENYNRVADTPQMWALDLANTAAGWVAKASMPLARTHASALAIDGKIYVLAGQTGYDGGLTAHDDIQIYDPTTNAWTVAAQKLPGARSHTSHSTIYEGGRIVIIGGESAHNAPVSDVWSIDPATLAITTLTAFPDSRFSAAAGVLGDKVYLFGGYKGSIPTQAYVGTITKA